jgi:hypothetical protein
MPVTQFKDMTALQRMEHRKFWLEWADRAQTTLGALLAETIDVAPAASDSVYEAVNKLIDVEQTLAGVLGR